jgi:hypothetical protein
VKRYVPALLIAMALAGASWAQDAGQDDAGTADTAVQPAGGPAQKDDDQADVKDDADLDEQGYKDQDDDFRPSEDIPADQSIAFPTDI